MYSVIYNNCKATLYCVIFNLVHHNLLLYFRQRVIELEKEITEVEHSSRLELAKHEKKSHENWV